MLRVAAFRVLAALACISSLLLSVTGPSATSEEANTQSVNSITDRAPTTAAAGTSSKLFDLGPWLRTETFTEPMASEETLRSLLLKETSQMSDLQRVLPSRYLSPNIFRVVRNVLASFAEPRPAYDRVANISSFSNLPTAQELIYPFLAQTVKRSSGTGVVLLRWEGFHQPPMWGKWLAQAIVDSDCRVALAPSLVWTFFRSNGSARYHQIHKEVFAKTIAMCKYLRHPSAAASAGTTIEWLPPRREYFNCIHDYTAPGDQIGLTLTCMYRFYSRYPTEGQRRNVTVLFPDAPEYPGLMNTIGMLQRQLQEVTIVLLPKNRFFGLRNGDMIAPSRVPGRLAGVRNSFVRQILWPRVNATFSSKLVPHRRVGFISTGSNRSHRASSIFMARMAKYSVHLLPPELPHDERMYHVNTADILITSSIDATNVNFYLGACCSGIPQLILVHSLDSVHLPSWCPPKNATCKGGMMWYHQTSFVKDDLDLVHESLFEEFLVAATSGPHIVASSAKYRNNYRYQ